MGSVNFGVPVNVTNYLKNILQLDIFVEGGTYQGTTAKNMSKEFRKVYTIEKSKSMYKIALENVQDISNIEIIRGDTREHLNYILESNNNILFWLDAHWCGGKSYGIEDECPLIDELKIIFGYNKNYIILIDDARLFLAPPPKPHKYKNWCSLKDIIDTIPADWELIEYEDVIYLYPIKINCEFKSFIQDDLSAKLNNPRHTFFQSILKKLG